MHSIAYPRSRVAPHDSSASREKRAPSCARIEG